MHVDKLSRSLENSHKRKNKIEGTEKLYLGDRNDITTNKKKKNHNHRSSRRESCIKDPCPYRHLQDVQRQGEKTGEVTSNYLLQVVERR